MIEELVHFYADRLKLEGVRTYNEDTPPSPAILLCALHPNLGGDMDNNVITSLARVSADMGFTSLRFNYRGVGNSESHKEDTAQIFQYWEESLSGENYMGAVTDTHVALNYLVSQVDVNSVVFIAGYSFGAIVGLRVGVERSNKVTGIASISTPFGIYNLDYLQHCNKPKLFIYSQNDFATSEEDTLKGFAILSSPKTLKLIENSDHFYRMQEDRVSREVCDYFKKLVRDT